MSRESQIKRYEPMGFLLVMSTIVIGLTVLFSLYKLGQNVSNGVIVAPVIDNRKWAEAGVLFFGIVLMVIAQYFFKNQKTDTFRSLFGMSFFILLFFFVIQITNFPFKRAASTATPEDLGYYYYGFITGVYSLFLLLGLMGHAILLYKVYRRISYIESFIFSVNPPNILNLKLLVRYMLFVGGLWLSILIFIKTFYAA